MGCGGRGAERAACLACACLGMGTRPMWGVQVAVCRAWGSWPHLGCGGLGARGGLLALQSFGIQLFNIIPDPQGGALPPPRPQPMSVTHPSPPAPPCPLPQLVSLPQHLCSPPAGFPVPALHRRPPELLPVLPAPGLGRCPAPAGLGLPHPPQGEAPLPGAAPAAAAGVSLGQGEGGSWAPGGWVGGYAHGPSPV